MRIIIVGGRDFNDYKLLEEKCIDILYNTENLFKDRNETIEIISGTARGADSLGERFAYNYKLKLKKFPADWNTYGKSAGYRRNSDMAIYAKQDNGVLIAFWDEKSKGTKHMIDLANKNNLRVFIVNY